MKNDKFTKLDNNADGNTNQKAMSDGQIQAHTEGQANGSSLMTSYRFGSVGQDTQLCLWDLNDDLLKQPIAKPKVSCSLTEAISSINLTDINLSNQNKNLEQEVGQNVSDGNVENTDQNINDELIKLKDVSSPLPKIGK